MLLWYSTELAGRAAATEKDAASRKFQHAAHRTGEYCTDSDRCRLPALLQVSGCVEKKFPAAVVYSHVGKRMNTRHFPEVLCHYSDVVQNYGILRPRARGATGM